MFDLRLRRWDTETSGHIKRGRRCSSKLQTSLEWDIENIGYRLRPLDTLLLKATVKRITFVDRQCLRLNNQQGIGIDHRYVSIYGPELINYQFS